VSLYNLCYYYVTNYSKIKNTRLFRLYILYEYENLKLKKEKLKLGSIVFQLYDFKYNGISLYYWFDMVYINQVPKGKTVFEKTLDFFKWSWSFSDICSLVIFLSIFYDFLSSNYILVNNIISKPTHNELIFNEIMLKQLCTLVDFEKIFFTNNLLKNQVKLSDLIIEISESNDFIFMLFF